MTMGALALALATPVVDRFVPGAWARAVPMLFSSDPEGARAVLGTIATAMIGVAGVVFSMTIVSLQLASAQFGPRLLRTFLRDTGSQVVLGTFLGTFLYCIVGLPGVDGFGAEPDGPRVAVPIAVAMAITSLGMLVYYVDHVAQSIHADAVTRSVGRALEAAIDQGFPDGVGRGHAQWPVEAEHAIVPAGEPRELRADRDGYVRFVNGDLLLELADRAALVLRIHAPPGRFVIPGDVLAVAWPAETVTGDLERSLRGAFLLGAHRTTLQDVTFAFEQLTEMAVRSLSPGINDPTTAVHCIDRIGAGLARLVERDRPVSWRGRVPDEPRLEIEPVSVEEVLEVTVDPLLRVAGVHLAVWLRLLGVLEAADRRARRLEDHIALRGRVVRLLAAAAGVFDTAPDRDRLVAAATWASAGEQAAADR